MITFLCQNCNKETPESKIDGYIVNDMWVTFKCPNCKQVDHRGLRRKR